MDILMPQLGETVAEGTVTNWYKKIGDAVRADEALFDVETDKVSTEIPSPVSGVLTEVLVPAGQTVKVGTRLAVVQTSAGKTLDASTETRGAAAAVPASAAVPTGAARSSSVALANAGSQGQRTSVPARAQGYETLARTQIKGHASQTVAPAQAGAQNPHPSPDSRLRGNDGASYAAAARAGSPAATAARDAQQKLSPVVRRLLAEHGLSPAAIRGSGRDGRITRDDVLNHVENEHIAPPPSPSRRGAGGEGEPPQLREAERLVPLNNIRRRSGAAMARAWQVVPHVLQAVEADYSRIEQARRARQAAWQAREGFELTYLPFLAFAVCQALARYEQLNARLEGDNLIVSRRVQLGIAVDLNHEGLVVPVIRDAQDRNVPALAREIRRLAVGARGNKLKADDFAQPTYTLSNSGVFGTLITAPIVNPPQVAILSTDGVSKRPVVIEAPEGDSIAARLVGVLAQSFDHRAVDGAYSAAFLKEVKRIVETRTWIDDIV